MEKSQPNSQSLFEKARSNRYLIDFGRVYLNHPPDIARTLTPTIAIDL